MKSRIKRRVQVDASLYFEYDVSPYRANLARIFGLSAKRLAAVFSFRWRPSHATQVSGCLPSSTPTAPKGMYIPFRQVRLRGQVNPLKPPVHVETVLIGRALGQQTGYLSGAGFRIRDDGSVEGEFIEGTQEFASFKKFRDEVNCRLADLALDSSTESDG